MKLFIVLALTVASASAASLNTIVKFGFPEGRIINGENAERGEAPYMVSLQFINHFCGGSLLTPNWILTAGHCTGIYNPILAVAGIDRLTNSLLGQIRVVTKQIQHENYEGDVGPNDIGLCFVNESFDLNAWVNVINLPLNSLQDTGVGKVFGFGNNNSGQSNQLLRLNATIISFDDCNDYWPVPPLAESNICIRKAGTSDSACSGDSGGPLIRLIDTVATQVGIVSWGRIPCGQDSAPTVFTAVSHHLPWIQDQLNSN